MGTKNVSTLRAMQNLKSDLERDFAASVYGKWLVATPSLSKFLSWGGQAIFLFQNLHMQNVKALQHMLSNLTDTPPRQSHRGRGERRRWVLNWRKCPWTRCGVIFLGSDDECFGVFLPLWLEAVENIQMREGVGEGGIHEIGPSPRLL